VYRATVIERRDVWFRDDGALTRTFCEDSTYIIVFILIDYVANTEELPTEEMTVGLS
jgi:hypothetical protein